MELSTRTPIYMGLITLSSALASLSFVWVGVLGFGLSALVLESVGHWLLR